jgi:glutaredoxin-related protein
MGQITLYSTHCPQCVILQEKLDAKGIAYTVVDDIAKMQELGFMSAPMLSLGDAEGTVLPFTEAVEWVKNN